MGEVVRKCKLFRTWSLPVLGFHGKMSSFFIYRGDVQMLLRHADWIF